MNQKQMEKNQKWKWWHIKNPQKLLKNYLYGVDRKNDRHCCTKKLFSVGGGESDIKLKEKNRQECHITFRQEIGTENRKYLFHLEIQIIGVTGVALAEEVV